MFNYFNIHSSLVLYISLFILVLFLLVNDLLLISFIVFIKDNFTFLQT